MDVAICWNVVTEKMEYATYLQSKKKILYKNNTTSTSNISCFNFKYYYNFI